MATVMLVLLLLAGLNSLFAVRAFGERAVLWMAAALSGLAAALAWIYALGDAPPRLLLTPWIESGTLSAELALVQRQTAPILTALWASLGFLGVALVFDRRVPKEVWPAKTLHRPRLAGLIALATAAGLLVLLAAGLLQLAAGIMLLLCISVALLGFDYRSQASGRGAQQLVTVGLIAGVLVLFAGAMLYAVSDADSFEIVLEPRADRPPLMIPFWGGDAAAQALAGVALAVAALALMGQVIFHLWLRETAVAPGPAFPFVLIGLPMIGLILLKDFWPLMAVAGLGPVLSAFGAVSALALALFAATQADVRRSVACLAGAQYGLVIVAYGAGAGAVGSGLFWAQGAALALLGWGVHAVMAAADHEGDVARLGGLRLTMPVTFVAMLVAAMGLSGVGLPVPVQGGALGLGGFAALAALFTAAQGSGLTLLLMAAVLASSFAVWRLIFLIFGGAVRAPGAEGERSPDAPAFTRAVLAALMLGVVFVGPLTAPAADLVAGAIAVPLQLMAGGAALAAICYLWRPAALRRLETAAAPAHDILASAGRVEKISALGISAPLLWLGDWLARVFDRALLDALFTRLARSLLPALTRVWARLGNTRGAPYAIGALVGAVLLSTLVAMVGV